MTLWHGFMPFLAEAPCVGIDPQPAYTPQPITARPTTAAAWAQDVYAASPTLAPLLLEIEQDAEEFGEEDDADIAMQVAIGDDGSLHVFDDGATTPFRTFTAAQVFSAYGMTLPEIPA